MKKILAFVMILVMLQPVTAFANSAPTHWRGSDANGIIIGEDNCPIVVEKEVLTFDIWNMPTQYHGETGIFGGDKFTAEYTLHNPTDMDITATVLFPFGKKGDYYSVDFMTNREFINNYYSVKIDGREIEKEKRYTFYPYNYEEFDILWHSGRISDGYRGDEFFNPGQKVTKYVVDCDQTGEDKILKLEWENKNDGTLLYTTHYNSGKFYDNSLTLTYHFDGDFIYYIVGTGPNRPQIGVFEENEERVYEGSGESVERLTESVEMTLEDFLTDNEYIKESFEKLDIMQADKENILADMFAYSRRGNEDRAFADHMNYYSIPEELMCWYRYEITIPAGGTVVNTVTAPLFPDVQTNREPDIYIYNYLLSPATKWRDFGNLEIVVNTPYYITESNVENFEKTETGYKSTFDTLPDGELSFTICEAEKPKVEKNYKYLIMFLPILAIPVGVAAVLIAVIIFVFKKKK